MADNKWQKRQRLVGRGGLLFGMPLQGEGFWGGGPWALPTATMGQAFGLNAYGGSGVTVTLHLITIAIGAGQKLYRQILERFQHMDRPWKHGSGRRVNSFKHRSHSRGRDVEANLSGLY